MYPKNKIPNTIFDIVFMIFDSMVKLNAARIINEIMNIVAIVFGVFLILIIWPLLDGKN